MQDTGWPDAPLDEYIELWDHDYWQIMRQTPPERKLLDIQACFQVAHGSGIRPEAILMQKVVNFDTLGRLLTSAEEHDPTTWPGTYMAKGLEIRDQWESQAAADQRLVAPLVAVAPAPGGPPGSCLSWAGHKGESSMLDHPDPPVVTTSVLAAEEVDPA